jgi:hypothetical protein
MRAGGVVFIPTISAAAAGAAISAIMLTEEKGYCASCGTVDQGTPPAIRSPDHRKSCNTSESPHIQSADEHYICVWLTVQKGRAFNQPFYFPIIIKYM